MKEWKRKDIEDMFTYLIREKMTSNEFWGWVRTWKEEIVLCEEADAWEIWMKLEALKKYGKVGEEDAIKDGS